MKKIIAFAVLCLIQDSNEINLKFLDIPFEDFEAAS
jgi:hypothetical protein